MKSRKFGFSAQLALILIFLLLLGNLILGFILMHHSRQSMKELIDTRMLDIANSAADCVNGDDLASFTKEDQNTPEYLAIMDALRVFQDNVDLKYIYCITEKDPGEFVFSVDPTVEDPGEFGSPIIYTTALATAAKGTPSVDDKPYTDAWGRFYSAYSPVFDSKGAVAGVVAVDFSADWYESKMNEQGTAILIYSILAVILWSLILMYATRKMRRQVKTLTGDLGDVMKNVDDLIAEMDPSFLPSEPYNYKADDLTLLRGRIVKIKDHLKQYTDQLHTHDNSMITALAFEYKSVYYVDLDRDMGICYQANKQIKDGQRKGEKFAYLETIEDYGNHFVTPQYREKFLAFVQPDTIKKALDGIKMISFSYEIEMNGQKSAETMRVAGVRHPEDRRDHMVHAVGFGFTDAK